MLESFPATGVQPIRCLNLGCGSRFQADWTNADMVSSGEGVIACDLTKGLAFEANTFDVVYHSHVLEHFPADMALKFLRECFRVLRNGGLIRVVVPDLEQIARLYLESLDAAISNDASAQDRHQWMMLEMYDQTVRETSGGNMAKYLRNPPSAMRDFVMRRLGVEASRLLGPLNAPDPSAKTGRVLEPSLKRTHVEAAPRKTILRQVAGMIRHPHRLREMLIRNVLGSEYELLKLGRFRRGGEIHQWMYDRYSLGRLLGDAGFKDAMVCGPADSGVSGWSRFNLDTEPDGTTYKPDSLFMEAVKP